MPKRQHETEIWNKRWFRELTSKEKIAFIYIKDNCDCVGVWDADFIQAEFLIGNKIDWQTLIEKVNHNIVVLPNDKWLLKDFCDFQYGRLSSDSDSYLVKNIIKRLKKHGLWDEDNQCIKDVSTLTPTVDSTLAPGYKEKEKDKEKKKEKEKEKEEYAPGVKMPCAEYKDLCERFGKKKIDGVIERISDYQLSKGKKKYDDYPATIKNWMRKDAGVDSVKELEIPKIPKCPKCGKSWENEINNNKSHCMGCNAPLPKSRGP